MRKKVEGKEVYRNYGLVVIAFLVVMTVSILIFFDVIRENVNSNTRFSEQLYRKTVFPSPVSSGGTV